MSLFSGQGKFHPSGRDSTYQLQVQDTTTSDKDSRLKKATGAKMKRSGRMKAIQIKVSLPATATAPPTVSCVYAKFYSPDRLQKLKAGKVDKDGYILMDKARPALVQLDAQGCYLLKVTPTTGTLLRYSAPATTDDGRPCDQHKVHLKLGTDSSYQWQVLRRQDSICSDFSDSFPSRLDFHPTDIARSSLTIVHGRWADTDCIKTPRKRGKKTQDPSTIPSMIDTPRSCKRQKTIKSLATPAPQTTPASSRPSPYSRRTSQPVSSSQLSVTATWALNMMDAAVCGTSDASMQLDQLDGGFDSLGLDSDSTRFLSRTFSSDIYGGSQLQRLTSFNFGYD